MLGRRLTTATALVAMLAVGALPAPAAASSRDIAATHAYIEANYALARASVARIGTGQARIEQLNASLARECPRIGIGSLENEAGQPISHLVADALRSIAYGTDAGPIHTFIDATRKLQWSSRKITRLAEAYESGLHQLATIALPNLCAVVSAWKASGFQVIPPATINLAERIEDIEANALQASLLAPFERGADAGLLARSEGLEIKLEEQEFTTGQTDWLQLLDTLGLHE